MTSRPLGVFLFLTACGGASTPAAEGPEEPPPPPTVAVALRLEEAPTDPATETPHTRIVLVAIDPEGERREAEVGIFDGACNLVTPNEGAVLEARCWWGPASAHVTVTREQDSLVATAEPDAREAARLSLPERAVLDPILPETLAR